MLSRQGNIEVGTEEIQGQRNKRLRGELIAATTAILSHWHWILEPCQALPHSGYVFLPPVEGSLNLKP